MILRILLALLIAAVVVAALVLLLQRRMLYFPDNALPPPPLIEAVGLQPWPQAGEAQRGWIGNDALSGERGTVIVFHGNAGAAWQRDYYAGALQPLGFRVILAEYPGYGGRDGSPSEQALVADGVATLAAAAEQFGGPLYLWGESLGSGVAAAVARQAEQPVAGVILLTPWDSLPSLAGSLYPVIPLQALLLDRYDSIANLAEFSGPVAVLVADEDEIIGERHSAALYEGLGQPKRRWRFAGAGHNSWPAEAGEGWWTEVMDFVTQAANP